MKYNNFKFKPRNSISYFRKTKFNNIKRKNLLDFYKGDYVHLESWIEHFKTLNVPFAITREHDSHRDFFILWKRRIA